MAKAAAQSNQSGYEVMGLRFQRIISSSAAQKSRSALIYRSPDESVDDWDRLLAEIANAEGVKLSYPERGAVKISWPPTSLE